MHILSLFPIDSNIKAFRFCEYKCKMVPSH